MRLREREQRSHGSQTMARELDMDRTCAFRLSGRCAKPGFNVTAVRKQRNFRRLLTLAQTLSIAHRCCNADTYLRYSACCRCLPGRQCLVWRDEASGCGRRAMRGGVNRRARATTLHDSCRDVIRRAGTYFVMRRRRNSTTAPLPSANRHFRRTSLLRLRWSLAMGRYADGAFCQFNHGGANIT